MYLSVCVEVGVRYPMCAFITPHLDFETNSLADSEAVDLAEGGTHLSVPLSTEVLSLSMRPQPGFSWVLKT